MPMNLPESVHIEPQDDSIFCRLYASTGKTFKAQRIHVPKMAREDIFVAHVVRTGPGKLIDIDKSGASVRLPMNVQPGDNIVYSRYKGERLNIDGNTYVIMRADDVLAKFTISEEDKTVFLRWATDLDTENQ